MENKIRRAFSTIHADADVVNKTALYLEFQRKKRAKSRASVPLRAAGAVAAMAAAITICVFTYYFYFAAAAYVSIDINPSVELTLNRMDRVIDTHAFNDDGTNLLNSLSLQGKKLKDATDQIVSAVEGDGYLTNSTLISLTVQTADSVREENLCSALLQSMSSQASAEVEVFSVSDQLRQTAHSCHMSPAKYTAIQELMEVDEDATLEEYSSAGIGQIRQRIQECSGENGESHANSGQGHQERGHRQQTILEEPDQEQIPQEQIVQEQPDQGQDYYDQIQNAQEDQSKTDQVYGNQELDDSTHDEREDDDWEDYDQEYDDWEPEHRGQNQNGHGHHGGR